MNKESRWTVQNPFLRLTIEFVDSYVQMTLLLGLYKVIEMSRADYSPIPVWSVYVLILINSLLCTLKYLLGIKIVNSLVTKQVLFDWKGRMGLLGLILNILIIAICSFFIGFSITILQFLQNECDYFIVLKSLIGAIITLCFEFINRVVFVLLLSTVENLWKRETFYSWISWEWMSLTKRTQKDFDWELIRAKFISPPDIS